MPDGEHLEAIAASLDRIERLLKDEATQRRRERYGLAKLHEELVEERTMLLAKRHLMLTWIATPAAVIAAIAAVVAVIVAG